MLLMEIMEISHQYCGLDLGINLLHGYLVCEPRISNRIGLVVMNPWEIFKTNVLQIDTIKLHRQFSRMGFRATSNRGDCTKTWWLSMEKYKTLSSDDGIEARHTDAPEEMHQIRVGCRVDASTEVAEAR